MVSTETVRMCTHTAEPSVKEPSQMSFPERIFLQRKKKKSDFANRGVMQAAPIS